MRGYVALALFVTAMPVATASTQTQLEAGAGTMMYDAGGDDSYLLVRVAVYREVTRAVRLGLAGSWSPIGPSYRPSLRDLDGDEELYRLHGTAGLKWEAPLRPLRIPVLDRLSPWGEVNLGALYSSGRTVSSDKKIGPSVGLAVGLDAALFGKVSLRGGFRVWGDFILGTQLFNTDQWVALAVGW